MYHHGFFVLTAMHLIDSHCHLNHAPLSTQWDALLLESQSIGINQFILPATQAHEFNDIAKLALSHSQSIIPAFGFHPFWVDQIQEQDWSLLSSLLERYPTALIGEIGLDFYQHKDQAIQSCQTDVLIKQLILAQEYHRPITLHLRKANALFWQLAKPYRIRGFMHAFSGSIEEANIAIAHGWLLGIGTVLLNPNARKIRDTVANIDLCHLVLETDAPYMRPQIAKEDYNHPKNLLMVAQEIAKIKQCTVEEVAYQTTENVLQMLKS